MIIYECQRSRLFFDFSLRSLVSKLDLFFFSKIVRSFETKFHVKTYGNNGINIYINSLGYMTKMATSPYFVNFLKIFWSKTYLAIALDLGM